jgi:hypothetical protein
MRTLALVIMIMGFTDPHLGLLGIIEEGHVEVLALVSLVGDLVSGFNPIGVVAAIGMMMTDVVTEVVTDEKIDVTTIKRKSK